jgi:hypothetical protein
VYDPDKPRLTEVTHAERDLPSCMRGDHGLVRYVLGWVGGLRLPTPMVIGLVTVLVAR